MPLEEVGVIKVVSGRLLAADPCYIPNSLGYGLAHVIDDLEEGEWRAQVVTQDEGTWGVRVAELSVVAASEPYYPRYWDHVGTAAVDSGQFSFTDEDFLPGWDPTNGAFGDWDRNLELAKEAKAYSYYGACAASVHKAGLVGGDRMVCSSSGYGDGGYEVYVARNAEGVGIGVKVIFIEDEEPEDEYEDSLEDEEEEYVSF